MLKPKNQSSMSRSITPEEAVSIATGGLLLSGECIGRRRRKIPLKDGGFKYVVSMTVMGGGTLHTVDRWCETPSPTDLPALGDSLLIPVRLRQFTTKGGQQMSKLEFGPGSDGEDF